MADRIASTVHRPFIVAVCALSSACGSTSVEPGVSSTTEPIVGGYVDEATRGAVSLGIQHQQGFIQHCSGTLIAPNLVLTARHCVSLTNDTVDEGVVCGRTEFTVQGSGNIFLASPETTTPVDVDDRSLYRGASVHAVPGANDMCGFDIALLILEGAGMPDSEATPIVPRIDSVAREAEEFSAEGFGLTTPDGVEAGVRMRVDGNTVDCVGDTCRGLTTQVRSTEWLSADARVCPGDSGGPALDAEGRVIGVASRGPTGCTGVIYGDVASWKDFVIETARTAAEQGGYEAPFWTFGSSSPPLVETPVDGGTVEPDDGPLGTPCDGSCAIGYECFAETGEPPGICVPRCGAGESCPSGYACADSLAVCVPEGSATLDDSSDDGGCNAAGPGPRDSVSSALLGLVALAGFRASASRRRRRVDRPRKRSGEIDAGK